MNDRFEELETRLAFQEDMIETLNHRVTMQEKELAELRLQIGHVNKKVTSVSERLDDDSANEPPPPHY